MAIQISESSLAASANLKAYYKLELGTLTTDSSGNSKTLTNNGTTGNASGLFGNAADFGSSNSSKYLSIVDNLGITQRASISCWVKLNSEIGSGNFTFASQQNDTNGLIYFIDYDYNGGTRQLRFVRARIGTADDVGTYAITLGTSAYYHLVITYDETNIKGYVNGALVETEASTGNGSGGVNRATIGNLLDSAGSPTFYASAIVDDVGFFNTDLTLTQVQEIYRTSPLSQVMFIT